MSRGPRRQASRAHQSSQRRYPRTARLNGALREVIAEALEDIDDDRLQMVTITGVDTDPDLRHAHVFFSALNGGSTNAETTEALNQHRVRLQAEIGRQMQLKFTPQLDFRPDLSILEGYKIESIIASMARSPEPPPESDDWFADEDGPETSAGSGNDTSSGSDT
jgi:ribosome-binding factor A